MLRDVDAQSWATVIAVAAAGVSTWQALVSRQAARYASRSANAAEITAVDTQRTADAAEKQLERAEVERAEANLRARIAAVKALKSATYLWHSRLRALSNDIKN